MAILPFKGCRGFFLCRFVLLSHIQAGQLSQGDNGLFGNLLTFVFKQFIGTAGKDIGTFRFIEDDTVVLDRNFQAILNVQIQTSS